MKLVEPRVSSYHFSYTKRLFDCSLSVMVLFFLSPLFLVVVFVIYLNYGPPALFLQERVGKNGTRFLIIKFRSMSKNAEKLKQKYAGMNESDGPVFKIADDPRFTPFGKILSRTGLDELPQFWNVVRGDMSIVGPRPFPVNEAKRLKKQEKYRELIKPGIVSSWVVNGSHSMSFKNWMNLDLKYVENASLVQDIEIVVKTTRLIIGFVLRLLNI